MLILREFRGTNTGDKLAREWEMPDGTAKQIAYWCKAMCGTDRSIDVFDENELRIGTYSDISKEYREVAHENFIWGRGYVAIEEAP